MPEFPLRVIDGFRLDRALRDALLPGGVLCDERGRARQLPRYFFEVPTREAALEITLAPNVSLWDLLQTDASEAPALHEFPRYVPCAVTVLAVALARFQDAAAGTVHIAPNGGYRSPAHRRTRHASTHCWAAAVDIARVGTVSLSSRELIEHFAAVARTAIPGVWIRPYGSEPGFAHDHLHLDLGCVVAVPHDAPGDPFNPKLEGDSI